MYLCNLVNSMESIARTCCRYGGLLIGLTVISNFYVAVDVLRSKLFYHSAFYFPLTKSEYAMLNKYRFINITLCENVIQFLTQLMRMERGNSE